MTKQRSKGLKKVKMLNSDSDSVRTMYIPTGDKLNLMLWEAQTKHSWVWTRKPRTRKLFQFSPPIRNQPLLEYNQQSDAIFPEEDIFLPLV